MAVETFYLNGSDASLGGTWDMDGAWSGDDNMIDGNTGTYATNTDPVAFTGEPGTNGIFVFGTSASGSGAISQVRARIHNGTEWGSYVTLDAPVAGWDWDAVKNLETFTQYGNIEGNVATYFYEDGDIQGTILSSVSVGPVSGEGRVSKVELEVTYSEGTPEVGVKYPLPAFRSS
jgi:hypothetical protein